MNNLLADPRRMTGRDRWIAFGLTFANLILCGVNYWYPAQKYFDEIYYPRSAMEYLLSQPQYEWTHPPFTKLLIAFSIWLWGGPHSALGNTAYGWRFMNVIVGAATVFLLYAFAKRLFRSTIFATYAAGLLLVDGFHFTQSRIATPEITVAFFSLLILYAFHRYWTRAEEEGGEDPRTYDLLRYGIAAGGALVLGGIVYRLIDVVAAQGATAGWLMFCFTVLTVYAIARVIIGPRPKALGELLFLAVAMGFGAASKWNDLFDLVLIFLMAALITMVPRLRWRLPLDAFAAIVLSCTIGIYLANYIPFFLTPNPTTFQTQHDLRALMSLQDQMFTYHDVTVARDKPHPYSSKWWEWPLLVQPVVYWYVDFRKGPALANGNACCVGEINSIPNPLTWWFGLISVPFLGFLAWTRRRKGYALLFIADFVQWLPWIASPRMLFEYHFFPNDAIILLADTAALQWLWQRYEGDPKHRLLVRDILFWFFIVAAALLAYFYPVLAGVHITYNQWHARMWIQPHWIIGPG